KPELLLCSAVQLGAPSCASHISATAARRTTERQHSWSYPSSAKLAQSGLALRLTTVCASYLLLVACSRLASMHSSRKHAPTPRWCARRCSPSLAVRLRSISGLRKYIGIDERQ